MTCSRVRIANKRLESAAENNEDEKIEVRVLRGNSVGPRALVTLVGLGSIAIGSFAWLTRALADVGASGAPIDGGTIDVLPDATAEPTIQTPPPPGIVAAAPTTTPVPRSWCCEVGPYLEPSLFIALGSYSPMPWFLPTYSNAGALTIRIGGGVVIRYTGGPSIQVRIGGTVYESQLAWSGRVGSATFGLGGEAEVNMPVIARARVGLRLGAESAVESTRSTTALLTGGARVRLGDDLWLGLDVFHIPRHQQPVPSCDVLAVPDCATSTTGVMVGLGLSGRYGLYGTAAIVSAWLIRAAVLAHSGNP